MAVREAFDVIAYSTLRHFSLNADGVRSLDSEAVHQMRVGLRRLRAAISRFKSVLPGNSTAKIKTDLKWLTNELAPAREIDVLVRERIRPLRHIADRSGAHARSKRSSQTDVKRRSGTLEKRWRRIAIATFRLTYWNGLRREEGAEEKRRSYRSQTSSPTFSGVDSGRCGKGAVISKTCPLPNVTNYASRSRNCGTRLGSSKASMPKRSGRRLRGSLNA